MTSDKEKSQSRLTPIDEDRRLIEEILPLKEISLESAREKSIRQGNISTIHLWWARRPIIASRAAVLGSLLKTNSTTINQQATFVEKICKWEVNSNKSLFHKALSEILESNGGKRPRVLDCFAGGGSIPLEAHRLGCEAYSLDLNPVAYLINLATIAYPSIYQQKYGAKMLLNKKFGNYKSQLANDIVETGLKVFDKVSERIKKLYPTSNGHNLVAHVWSRVIKCPNPSCGCTMPLMKNFILAERGNSFIYLVPTTINNELFFEVKQSDSKDKIKLVENVKRGSVCCLTCGQTVKASDLRRLGNKGEIREILAASIYESGSRKQYKTVSKEEKELFMEAVAELSKIEEVKIDNDLKLIPDEDMPSAGALGFRIPRYGFKKWRDVYNERQLFSITSFILSIEEMIKDLKAKKWDEERIKIVSTYIAFALDRLAPYSTNLSLWSSKGEFICQIFSQGQALPMRWDYAEVNPLSNSTGNWKGALEWICRVVDECSSIDTPIASKQIMQGSALNLPFTDGFFDAVIIDPPYYDSVPYSDLSDFFYVILKRSLHSFYPLLFKTPLTPKSNEIIQEPNRHGGYESSKKFFETKLTDAFKECNRVIRDEGIFVVIFAHKSTSAWETLVNSLLNSQYIVTASWAISTERPGRLRSHNSAALASSIFIACRKRKSNEVGYFNEVKDELKKKIHVKLDQFWSQGIRGADFFISAIGPAVEVFGKYKKVTKLTGEEVSVAELLDLVREIVTDYSLHKILKEGQMSNVDEQTRFYLLWRWAYDDADVPYDDARKLAQALGAEVDELLTRKDILQKKGDKVNLLEPGERQKNQHLGEQKGGIRAPMVDVIHKACLLWEKSAKDELAEFLESSGYSNNDTIWIVAQAISEVLPDGNKERQLIQGLLASRQSISQDAVESAKQGKLGDYVK